MRLQGKTALINGGSSGIELATARLFAAEGGEDGSRGTLVLGSGPGGILLAWHLARSGQRVAVVERRYVGGSCPNIACMPSKNEVWAARIAYLARHAAQFGTITGPVTMDMVKVRQRKRDMVDKRKSR